MVDSGSGDEIVLPIRLSTEEAEQTLATFKATAAQSGQDIAAELEAGTAEAGGGLGFLTEKLRDHTREMGQERRMIRTLSLDLAGLGLDAKGAGGEIAHLVSSFAIGGGLMGGAAAVKLVVGYFQELGEEEKKADEASQKWIDGSNEGIGKLREKVDELIYSLQGATRAQALAHSTMPALLAAEEEKTKALEEAQNKLAAAKAKVAEQDEIAQQTGSGALGGNTDALQAEVARAQRERDQAVTAVVAAQEQIRRATLAEGEKTATAVAAQMDANAAKRRAQAEANRAKDEAQRQADQDRRDKEEGAQALKLIKEQEKTETEKLQAEHYYDTLREVGGDEQKAKELVALEEHYGKLSLLFSDNQEYLTLVQQEYARKRAEIFQKEAEEEEQTETALHAGLVAIGEQSLRRLEQSVGSAFNSIATHAGAYQRALIATGQAQKLTASEAEAAVEAQLQAVLGGIAQEATVRAVMETGLGIATLFTNPAESASHFTAAAVFGGIGALTAAMGYGIGELRPMTQEERQNAYGTNSSTSSSLDTSGARGAGSTSSNSGGVVKETVILVADPFETPQEAARRAAQRVSLAQSLDLFRRPV